MTKNRMLIPIAVLSIVIGWPGTVLAQSTREQSIPPRPATAVSPLIERYMLDELKALRTELAETRINLVREVTDRELKVAENVSNLANNTVTFFFYLFAGLGAVFAIWGWRSIRDIKQSALSGAESEIRRLSQEYEVRLTQLEQDLLSKGAIILENQREIERTQTIHSLWLQSNQAPNPRSKIEIYDRILEHTPGDIEVMAHKADAALALGDRDWALSLCNRILEDNPDSGLALYQRACAKAGLGEVDSAIIDLNKALELTPALLEEAQKEEEFTPLVGLADFDSLMNRPTADAPVTPMKDGAA
ncbi:MAG: tetratricopeptide (TPR) repeat protein [Alphaproteobacteria bacterium]|jgi:tetratricopeptide (TPR) repeat protein